MSATIPRFLLPRGSVIWRPQAIRPTITGQLRSAATKPKATASSKPRVLEKPTKFNPPSHGNKLRSSTPRSYPGPQLSAEEQAARRTKQYPNMMPAEGTFLHWFVTSRSIHIYITLGTLMSLATFTFWNDFRRTSKFADLLPPFSDVFFHPINWTRQVFEVLRLHTAAVAAETQVRRQRNVDDVAKRDMFRKAHGKDTDGFGGWSAKGEGELLGPAIGNTPVNLATSATGVATDEDGGLQEHVEQQQARRPLKKWLGIW